MCIFTMILPMNFPSIIYLRKIHHEDSAGEPSLACDLKPSSPGSVLMVYDTLCSSSIGNPGARTFFVFKIVLPFRTKARRGQVCNTFCGKRSLLSWVS